MPATRSSKEASRNARSGSPYASRSNSVNNVGQGQPDPPKRYGLRSMLSSLIWGSSKDANPKADSDGRIGQAEENGHTEVHAISDDDEEDEKSNVEPAPARWTAQQKGKGRSPSPTYRSQGPGRLTSSHTFGDLRSAHRDFDDITPDTTPAQSPKKRSNAEMDEPKSPADVNSALANFFAGKGSQTLTADERRHVATLLQQGPPTSGYSETSSAGPASPKFTFAIPSPARPTTTAALLAPPNYSISRSHSSTNGGNAFPSNNGRFPALRGGLTGSQSMSGLASLSAAASNGSTRVPAASNPRSAASRRAAARPIYLGAGYSSTAAAARRKRAAASLFSNIESFASSESTPMMIGTPGKRRRVGEDAETSTPFTVLPSSSKSERPSTSVEPDSSAPPPFYTASPQPNLARPLQAGLFASSPNLRAAAAATLATPIKPSPLRRNGAVASTPFATPPSVPATRPNGTSTPRTISRTAGLMMEIVGDTRQSQESGSSPPSKSSQHNGVDRVPISTPLKSDEQPSRKKVPRENLVKQPTKLSAAEVLDRTVPPELRSDASNGRPGRPKPPPLPASARKTRAQTAADVKRRSEASETPVESSKPAKGRGPSPRPPSRDEQAPRTENKATKVSEENSRESSVEPSVQTEFVSPKQSSKSTPFSFAARPKAATSEGTFQFGGFQAAPKPKEAGSERIASRSPAPAGQPVNKAVTPVPASDPSGQPVETENSELRQPHNPEPRKRSADAQSPQNIALRIPAIQLPAFTLYDSGFTLSGDAASADDAKVKALKATILDMPARELRVFELYSA